MEVDIRGVEQYRTAVVPVGKRVDRAALIEGARESPHRNSSSLKDGWPAELLWRHFDEVAHCGTISKGPRDLRDSTNQFRLDFIAGGTAPFGTQRTLWRDESTSTSPSREKTPPWVLSILLGDRGDRMLKISFVMWRLVRL